MEDWVYRALAKWPNVPHLYGWLRLDRRGRWLIKGEIISRPQIIDTINANYAADERGGWYFQNGPQRGYVALDYAPLVLRHEDDPPLRTHTGLIVKDVRAAYLDEEGALLLDTEHGPGVLEDAALPWALEQLRCDGRPADDDVLAAALALPSGQPTALRLQLHRELPLQRLDSSAAPAALGFLRDPQPP